MSKLLKVLFVATFGLGLTVSHSYASNNQSNNNNREKSTQQKQQSQSIRKKDEEQAAMMDRSSNTPVYKCIECGGFTGGAYYPFCQWCHLKNGGKW